MKHKIKIRLFNEKCMPEQHGDWIDLKADLREEGYRILSGPYILRAKKNDDRQLAFVFETISLGVAMQLPKGYEAVINPRSSMFKNTMTLLTNSQGVIDNDYNGDNDIWRVNLLEFGPAKIHDGDRICQFRIQLSQNATFWQKLKHLFYSGIKFERVITLNNKDRGGFGSTGI